MPVMAGESSFMRGVTTNLANICEPTGLTVSTALAYPLPCETRVIAPPQVTDLEVEPERLTSAVLAGRV